MQISLSLQVKKYFMFFLSFAYSYIQLICVCPLQNSDDTCLGYTLASICNLLSEVGMSSTNDIMGSTYSPGSTTSLGTSLSTQQQLLLLLERSLKRAESLKLTRLVAFNRLAMAKFDLKVWNSFYWVKFPFGGWWQPSVSVTKLMFYIAFFSSFSMWEDRCYLLVLRLL